MFRPAFKNFAESAHATYSAEGIRVCCVTVSGLTYGGDNVKGDHDAAANARWKLKLGDSYVSLAARATEGWEAEVVVSPDLN